MATAAMAVMPQAAQYFNQQMTRRVAMVAQDRLFGAIDRFLGLSRFEDPDFLDRLRLAQQAGGSTPNSVVEGLLSIVRALITITGFLGSLYLLSPLMTILALGAGLPVLVAENVLSRQRVNMYWNVGPHERRELFYAQLLGSVAAAKEVRLFDIGAFLRKRMMTERATADDAKRVLEKRTAIVQSGLSILAASVFSFGLIWAVLATIKGQLSIGDITVLIAAIAGVQSALGALAGGVGQLHQSMLMFRNYLLVTGAAPDLPVLAAPRPLPELHDGIELQDVWFRYSKDHPWVLRGVTFRISAGKSVALVGLNGAGKSTLVKLLCRFYDPTRGDILWDGVNLRDTDPSELRQRVSALFQDFMQYDLTAAENIALGDLRHLSDEGRIHAAALRAGIHETLSNLPRGYSTLLSRNFFTETDKDNPDTGVVLSGGQWQRLALARSLLRDRRDFMILDEPSAGLDAEAEHEIHTTLKKCRAGLTSLLISHRLSSVRDADHIAVLSEGRIVESGDHCALVTSGGLYWRLFTMQASGYNGEQSVLRPGASVD
ncbi:ABC transporter ATP-binding protein [Spongiactinospora gelatinilytica]|uniref:ABC transporter ATP-binding protein n=1 Tax=Spongiactinospora gelatinilytica TaxID=2666298 RepID=UPI001F3F3B78|nr:ABC transporter ATP-binding protein [Spongiactinospora gelatinilytica]